MSDHAREKVLSDLLLPSLPDPQVRETEKSSSSQPEGALVFMVSTSPGVDRQMVLTPAGRAVYIRVVDSGTVNEGEALDLGDPMPDESVMNSHLLPDAAPRRIQEPLAVMSLIRSRRDKQPDALRRLQQRCLGIIVDWRRQCDETANQCADELEANLFQESSR